MKLDDKVALVTGAGSGIGREIARTFAGEGASLALVDFNPDGLRETLSLLPEGEERFMTVTADIRKVPEIEDAVRRVVEKFGGIDILVNNAGTQVTLPIGSVTEDDWNRVVDTNLRGTYFMTQQVFNVMRPRHYGRIVNLSSLAAIMGSSFLSVYAASKGGIYSLTRALAAEMAGSNITVNAICPGFINTPMIAESMEIDELREMVLDQTPLERVGEPRDVAGLALFLASDDASFITGQAIPVDGGLSAV